MLGSITHRTGTYVLDDDGEWTGPNAAIVEMLEVYSIRYYSAGPPALPMGYEAVKAAAKAIGDPNPKLPAFRESTMPPGTIY